MLQWYQDMRGGSKNYRRMLTITELTDAGGGTPPAEGKQYVYHDCFPTRYVFPRMSVTNTTGNVMEEVSIKPIRLELK
jgi:hypothetical protein